MNLLNPNKCLLFLSIELWNEFDRLEIRAVDFFFTEIDIEDSENRINLPVVLVLQSS